MQGSSERWLLLMSLAYPCLLGDATIKFEHFWWVIVGAAKPSILPFNYLTYHHQHKNSSNKPKLPAHIPIILFHAALAGYSALGSLCLHPLLQSRKKQASWYLSDTAMALKHIDREGSGETLGLLLWLWKGESGWLGHFLAMNSVWQTHCRLVSIKDQTLNV